MAPNQLLSLVVQPIIKAAFCKKSWPNWATSTKRLSFLDCGNCGFQVWLSMCSSRGPDIYVSLSQYSQGVTWGSQKHSAFLEGQIPLRFILPNVLFTYACENIVILWQNTVNCKVCHQTFVKMSVFFVSFSCASEGGELQTSPAVTSWNLVGSLMTFVAALISSCFPPALPPYPSPPLS